MSLYQKASLVQIPSGYKASAAKLYSVVPSSGDGDFTISADADATRVNKDGLVESVAANQARLNYDPSNPQDPHLLLEPTRTQLAHYTNAISSTNGYSLINGTLTTNSHTAPDGTSEASTFKVTSSLGQFQKVKTGSSGVQYTVSAYVKRKTGTGTVYLRAVENANTAVTVTDEWTRVSLTVTSTSTNIRYGMALATSGDEIYVWGFQVEAGSYATSLIPNPAGIDITRTADTCKINSGIDNILNTNEGTLFFDLEAFSTTLSRISISDQTSGTDYILLDLNNGSLRPTVRSSAGYYNPLLTTLSTNTRIKLAFTYSSSQIRMSYNGNTVITTNISYTPTTTLESFKFSLYTGDVQVWQGKIYQAMYFNTALTNTELQTLTS
jgi:hypothetical protein